MSEIDLSEIVGIIHIDRTENVPKSKLDLQALMKGAGDDATATNTDHPAHYHLRIAHSHSSPSL